MSYLVKLPSEIIIQVLGHLDNFELESFAATCSYFRGFEKQRLDKHKRLKIRYGDVCIDRYSSMKELRTTADFIRFLVTHPEVLRYPRKLSYWQKDCDFREREPIPTRSFTSWCKWVLCVDVLRDLINWFPLFGHVEHLGVRWRGAVAAGKEGAIFALLLLLLSNLKQLNIAALLFTSPEIQFLVKTLEKTQNEEIEPLAVLPNLEEVISIDTRPNMTGVSSAIRTWSMFPSIRRISMNNPVEATYYPQESGLTYTGGEPCNTGLVRLLDAVPKLNVFKYKHASVEWSKDADLYSTTKTLLNTHGKTLEELIFEVSAEAVFERPVPSLREFSALKRVSIDPILLVNPKDGCVAKLVNLLPPSIEAIALGKSVDRGLIKSTFEGMKDRGKECLPKFCALHFYPHQRSILPFLHKIAKEARLKIKTVSENPDFAEK